MTNMGGQEVRASAPLNGVQMTDDEQVTELDPLTALAARVDALAAELEAANKAREQAQADALKLLETNRKLLAVKAKEAVETQEAVATQNVLSDMDIALKVFFESLGIKAE